MSGICWQEQGYIKSALTAGLLCALVFTVIVYGVLRYQAGLQTAAIKVDESAKAKLTSGLLTQIFDYAANDLRAISKLPTTQRFNRDRTDLQKDLLKQVFQVQLEQKPDYSQIRFFDNKGTELVRLDHAFGRTLTTPSATCNLKGTAIILPTPGQCPKVMCMFRPWI